MEREEILAKWRAVVTAIDPDMLSDFSDEGPPDHLFHLFRPDGAGVEALFEGMEERDAVTARLKKVYQAAGDDRDGAMYFVVRDPPRAASEQIIAWTNQHLSRLKRVESELFELDGPSEIEAIEGVDVVSGGAAPRRDPSRAHPLETALYEAATELGMAMGGSEWARLLDEPLYKIACDYRLAHWILWPHIGGDFPVEDPFAAWFELWRHGAVIHFHDEERDWSFDQNHRLRVWVPG